jgi:glutamyl-tRNA reductase
LAELAARSEQAVLVCPIGVTTDYAENRETIESTGARRLEHEGGRLLSCPSLNDFEPFVKAVSVIARRGPHPVSGPCGEPLLRGTDGTFDPSDAIGRLVMVGACAPGRIASAAESGISHLSRHEFRQVKRPQSGALELLRDVHAEGRFTECWLWNTCNRFEFYGIARSSHGSASSDQCVTDISRCMFAYDVDGRNRNVLRGVEAWRHLLNTAAGLNSSLPGDIDVLEQLGASFRLARHAGVAGATADRLLGEIRRIIEQVRTRTPWGRFGTGYCHAALNELAATVRPPWAECRCVVIGASTTSWSILRTLVNRFAVPQEQLTAVYRGGGRHRMAKMLRQATGRGRRVLVRKYAERGTFDAIVDADVLFFGVDQAEPIVRARQLADLRRNASGPLTIVDFNTFGSTDRIEGIEGIRLVDARQIEAHVDRFAERIVANQEFHSAAAAARDAIAMHVEEVSQGGQHTHHRSKGPAAHDESAALQPVVALNDNA